MIERPDLADMSPEELEIALRQLHADKGVPEGLYERVLAAVGQAKAAPPPEPPKRRKHRAGAAQRRRVASALQLYRWQCSLERREACWEHRIHQLRVWSVVALVVGVAVATCCVAKSRRHSPGNTARSAPRAHPPP